MEIVPAAHPSPHRSPYKPLALREHFRARRFGLSHHDLRAFTSSWLPLPLFVAYRILLPVYLSGWTIAHILDRRDTEGTRWLIFITNWSSLLLLTATTLAAIMTLIFSIKQFKLAKRQRAHTHTKLCSGTETSGNENYSRGEVYSDGSESYNRRDDIHWTVKIFWVLYITSQTVIIMVCIGFWSTQYEPCIDRGAENNTILASSLIDRNTSTDKQECGVDFISIHVHGINAVIVICDILLSLVPFNALHFLYPCTFTLIYVVFSGIYYAADGTNESGDPYIYSILNYGESPVMSSIAAILLVSVPAFIYVIPLLLACARDGVYKCITERFPRASRRENGTQLESNRKPNFSNPCT